MLGITFLLLSILCSTIIVLIFKMFQIYRVNTFHAIVVNYITCVLTGLPFTNMSYLTGVPVAQPWFILSVILGILFILIFYLIGITAQKSGITVTSVSMKLSLAVPILLAFFVYNEHFSWLKFCGIILAFAAVILTSIKFEKRKKTKEERKESFLLILLPLLVFIGSGMTDSIIQYTKKTFFDTGGFDGFVLYLFGTAALIGLIVMTIQYFRNKEKIIGRSIIGGIVLGVPNYGSIYFFYAALVHTGWETSVVFPLNNIAIVGCASLAALLLFNEKLSKLNIAGLACAFSSITLIVLSEYYA